MTTRCTGTVVVQANQKNGRMLPKNGQPKDPVKAGCPNEYSIKIPENAYTKSQVISLNKDMVHISSNHASIYIEFKQKKAQWGPRGGHYKSFNLKIPKNQNVFKVPYCPYFVWGGDPICINTTWYHESNYNSPPKCYYAIAKAKYA